jgi:hypothetical protein
VLAAPASAGFALERRLRGCSPEGLAAASFLDVLRLGALVAVFVRFLVVPGLDASAAV